MSELKLVITGHGRGEAFLDGVKIHKIRKVSLSVDADCKANEAVIEIIPDVIEVSGMFDVITIESEARELRHVESKEHPALKSHPPPPTPPPSRIIKEDFVLPRWINKFFKNGN